MENYTKYKLKSSDELASVLDGKDNLFVIACNKCFKEFETVDEPDCDEFLKFAADQGKKVTGSAKFDFLCNKMHTERKLQDLIPEGTENVVVISCGLGIQTVADLAGKPVVAASNTLNYRGHHGMALTKKSCDFLTEKHIFFIYNGIPQIAEFCGNFRAITKFVCHPNIAGYRFWGAINGQTFIFDCINRTRNIFIKLCCSTFCM